MTPPSFLLLRARSDLDTNQLTGSIPSSLGDMTALQILCVHAPRSLAVARPGLTVPYFAFLPARMACSQSTLQQPAQQQHSG